LVGTINSTNSILLEHVVWIRRPIISLQDELRVGKHAWKKIVAALQTVFSVR